MRTKLSATKDNQEVTGVLDQGSEFDGVLSFEGAFRIGGTFKGKIFSDDILIIGEGAEVSAEIEVGTLILSGNFEGSVKAKDRVEIHYPAVFRGNIQSPSLMVADGVVFEGVSQMNTEAQI
ncbi:MAG: polymer-forming cytoskeletal protein [Oligoflexia bacterium]|nr:polymer-forming cytoskeletal protein [Oligoflexia bacterium]